MVWKLGENRYVEFFSDHNQKRVMLRANSIQGIIEKSDNETSVVLDSSGTVSLSESYDEVIERIFLPSTEDK